MTITELYDKVELAISAMGLKPSETRGDEQGQWMFVNDFRPIYIDAWEETEQSPFNYYIFKEDKTVFQLMSPVCYAPTLKRDEFFKEILSLNLLIHHVKFMYNESDNVVAMCGRIPGISFNKSLFHQQIEAISYYSEMFFQVLKDEFKLKKVSIEE